MTTARQPTSPAPARCLVIDEAWQLVKRAAPKTTRAVLEHARVTAPTCRVLVVDQRCS